MKRKITVTGANIVFFLILALCLVYSFVLGIIDIIFKGFSENNFYAVNMVIQYGIILIPVLLYVFTKGINFKKLFRFNKLDGLPALLIIIISVPALWVANMLNSIVLYLLQFIGEIPPNPIPVPQNWKELVTGIFFIAVTPAFCEELLNRGLILRAYENRGSQKAIVISAIFFGFFHFDVTNLLGPIFLGLLIGYYVVKTNSIFAGMLAHFMNNALSELFSFYSRNEPESQGKMIISSQELVSTVGLGITALVLVVLFLAIFRYLTRGNYQMVPAVSSIKLDVISILSHWPVIIIITMYVLVMVLYLLGMAMSGYGG